MKSKYKTTTFLNLPPDDNKLPPGSIVTKAQLEEAGQTDDNIAQLLKSGVLSEDLDTPINKVHEPVEVPSPTYEAETVTDNDEGKGEITNG